MATSPTSRTLKYLKDKGHYVGVVERFLAFAGKFGQRKDLFNIIDIIAITKEGILGVQSCGQAFSEHDKKILAEPMSKIWLESGAGLLLIGWRKVKVKRGGKAMVWEPRIKYYGLEDFEEEVV